MSTEQSVPPSEENAAGDDIAARMAKLSPAQRALLERMTAGRAASVRPATTPVQRELVRIWREVLKVDQFGVDDSFFALGGDSITSLQVSARAAAAGIRVTSRQILDAETIEQLAVLAEQGSAVPRVADDPIGDVPLTPIQRWFFEQRLPESHHWDQTIFVHVAPEVTEEPLRAALRALVGHHDVLRSRFTASDGQWRHTVLAEHPDPHLAVVEPTDRTPVDEHVAAAQGWIDLVDGPLVSAVLFRGGADAPGRLLLAVHHLVVDGVSLRVLVDDLAAAYAAEAAGEPVTLPERTTSFRSWSKALHRYAAGAHVREQAEYWLGVPDAAAAAIPAFDGPQVHNTVDRCVTLHREVAPEVVAALRGDAPGVAGASVATVLLGAFAAAWQSWTGRRSVQLDLERHGREHIDDRVDVARTVGWFTVIHPLVLTVPEPETPAALLDSVRRQLDRVPDNGIGYGLLRYLFEQEGPALAALPQSSVSFNYLGWFERAADDALFGAPAQAPAQLQSRQAPRRYQLDVVVTGIEDRLVIDVGYPGDACARDRVESFVDGFVAAIGRLARWTAATRSSRFPLAGASDDHLARIVRQVSVTR